MTTDTTKPTPADREALIEQIARGIQEADGLEGMQFWEDVPEWRRRQYIHVARYGLLQAEAAGVVCVPADPTDEQARAGCSVPLNKAARHNICYRQMIAASPYANQEG